MTGLLISLLMLTAPSGGPQANCANPQAQWEMTVCAGKDFERADRELTLVWKKAVEREDPAGRVKLRAAQRAWLQFRKAQCEFEADEARGGSAQSMMLSECLARLTRERTKQIRPPASR